jgi:hypothetical protein
MDDIMEQQDEKKKASEASDCIKRGVGRPPDEVPKAYARIVADCPPALKERTKNYIARYGGSITSLVIEGLEMALKSRGM